MEEVIVDLKVEELKYKEFSGLKVKIDVNDKCCNKWNHLANNQEYKKEFEKLWSVFLQDPDYKWWIYLSYMFGFLLNWVTEKDNHFWKEIESLANVLNVNPLHLYYFQFWIESNYNISLYHSKDDKSLFLIDWIYRSFIPNPIMLEVYNFEDLMVRGYTLAGSVGIFHGYVDAVYYSNIQIQKRIPLPYLISSRKKTCLTYKLRKAFESYTCVETFMIAFYIVLIGLPFIYISMMLRINKKS